MHVHIFSGEAEAKFWIEPEIELATNHGIPEHQLSTLVKILNRRHDEIRSAWHRHFGT
jgi:hypothetical protein